MQQESGINQLNDCKRLLFAAPASGTGKTTITCGILQCLKNRGLKVAGFKCGPDYIDPMFHKQVIEIPSKNLDTFFLREGNIQKIFYRGAKDSDISIIEGVMGYYDGIGETGMEASSYELSKQLQIPTVLIVNGKGMSTSLLALLKGFKEYQEDSNIEGVIINRVSEKTYRKLVPQISKLGIKPLGYVPLQKNLEWGSRHLGLLLPEEIEHLKEQLECFAEELERTVDIEALLQLAKTAKPLSLARENGIVEIIDGEEPLRLGVARDEAFCFYYQDNLELLEQKGVQIHYFSPLTDQSLPPNLDGILLGGGYPENYARMLSENQSMKSAIKDQLEKGMPYLAECGGFLYLQESIQVADQNYPMCGILKGHAKNQGKLTRFGYLQLECINESQDLKACLHGIKGHEFHYYDSSENGTAMRAVKPDGRSFECMVITDHSVAGFPHLYYPSKPEFIDAFLECCRTFRERKQQKNGEIYDPK